jgi:Fic family protein
MRIEAARRSVTDRPMTARMQARLRETARLHSSHYSTQIEGNRLTLAEASLVIEKGQHFAGRLRDEKEVLGYYRALDHVEALARARRPITEATVKTLHALVMTGKRGRVKPTPYRDGQNVIRDGVTGAIVYLPPEPRDVAPLMSALVEWLAGGEAQRLPCPLRASIAHYQFATIHPYFDGNGRTARLLATLVLHLGGYGLKGFFSLEENYARDLAAYYQAIAVGPSHNYYFGRAEADITGWIEYLCDGMADSFDSVDRRAREASAAGARDQSRVLRKLDARQKRVLDLFDDKETITSADVGQLLGLAPRTARDICQSWVKGRFLKVVDPSRKGRRYGLTPGMARQLSTKGG